MSGRLSALPQKTGSIPYAVEAVGVVVVRHDADDYLVFLHGRFLPLLVVYYGFVDLGKRNFKTIPENSGILGKYEKAAQDGCKIQPGLTPL
jgi:hypothetical protein